MIFLVEHFIKFSLCVFVISRKSVLAVRKKCPKPEITTNVIEFSYTGLTASGLYRVLYFNTLVDYYTVIIYERQH